MNRTPLCDLHPTGWFDWIVQTKALDPGCLDGRQHGGCISRLGGGHFPIKLHPTRFEARPAHAPVHGPIVLLVTLQIGRGCWIRTNDAGVKDR